MTVSAPSLVTAEVRGFESLPGRQIVLSAKTALRSPGSRLPFGASWPGGRTASPGWSASNFSWWTAKVGATARPAASPAATSSASRPMANRASSRARMKASRCSALEASHDSEINDVTGASKFEVFFIISFFAPSLFISFAQKPARTRRRGCAAACPPGGDAWHPPPFRCREPADCRAAHHRFPEGTGSGFRCSAAA